MLWLLTRAVKTALYNVSPYCLCFNLLIALMKMADLAIESSALYINIFNSIRDFFPFLKTGDLGSNLTQWWSSFSSLLSHGAHSLSQPMLPYRLGGQKAGMLSWIPWKKGNVFTIHSFTRQHVRNHECWEGLWKRESSTTSMTREGKQQDSHKVLVPQLPIRTILKGVYSGS